MTVVRSIKISNILIQYYHCETYIKMYYNHLAPPPPPVNNFRK